MIEIVIDGYAQAQRAPQGVIVPPLPKAMRGRHSVRMYTPAEVKTWQTTARVIAAEKMKGNNPLKGQLEVTIAIYLPVPISMSNKKTALALAGMIRPITRPDADNYCKAVLDSLNGIVWLDDAQVVSLHVYKFYGEKPLVRVRVVEIEYPHEHPLGPAKQSGLFE